MKLISDHQAMTNTDTDTLFKSFFMCGYECTYALVEKKERFDLLKASMHDQYCKEDYQTIKKLGIETVREGLAWHQIDKGSGEYDFSRFEKMMQVGKEEGVQQIWDLNHFDYPENLDFFSHDFIARFSEYAKRAINLIRKYQTGTIYIVPINEISFSAWIGADRGLWAPYKTGPANGFAFKKQLVRAAIAAMDAIWKEDNDVRFIQVDPILRRIPRDPSNKKVATIAREFNDEIRFQAWDMLSGRVLKEEVGGNPKYLDIIGINYYAVNQEWIMVHPETKDIYQVMIPPGAPEHLNFTEILKLVHERYNRPMIISETGSHGEFRPSWWEKILKETQEAIAAGMPIHGICAYPTVDKPSSLHFLWPQSGLWDFDPIDPACHRHGNEATLVVIKDFIEKNRSLAH